MWKVLLACFILAAPMIAAETQINQSNINFPKDTKPEEIDAIFKMAMDEYNYSNFGFSRDLFTAIVQKTDVHPSCYLYLGKIYEEVAQFKNKEMSSQNYLIAANSENLRLDLRQDAYTALIRLTDNSKLAIKYAKASNNLGSTDQAKKGLMLAYQKGFNQTGNADYLRKSKFVAKSMNDKYFGADNIENVQTVNYVRIQQP